MRNIKLFLALYLFITPVLCHAAEEQRVANASTVNCSISPIKSTDIENEQTIFLTEEDIVALNNTPVAGGSTVCTGGYREDQNRSVGKSR